MILQVRPSKGTMVANNPLVGDTSKILYFHSDLWGNDPILTSIFFKMGWFNHQLETDSQSPTLFLEVSINSSLLFPGFADFLVSKKDCVLREKPVFQGRLRNQYRNLEFMVFNSAFVRSTGQGL